jgi:hypothetical protein
MLSIIAFVLVLFLTFVVLSISLFYENYNNVNNNDNKVKLL